MQTIGNIIAFKTNPGLGRSLEAAVVLARANEISENKWQATQYRKGVLTITANNPMQAQELVLRREQLQTQLNALFGDKTVQRLVIRTQG